MRCGAVSTESIREIAELLELHPSEVHDTMSFYNFFKDENTRWASTASGSAAAFPACCEAVKNCWKSLQQVSTFILGRTSADGKVTLEFAECLGACEGAPCAFWWMMNAIWI
jgi:NADH-quinone oxidoreductase subunit E